MSASTGPGAVAQAAPAASDEIVVEVSDLTAGYLPVINIINGATLVARKG